MSHIAVEKNRRRQMNEHLKVLRSLTPCFYIKRGDQASIIGGVIEFINELHQVLESKKRRKSLSPSPSPKPVQFITHHHLQPVGQERVKEVAACCNSPVADVEAKISGSNVILKILSKRIPGQTLKIITVLEKLFFQVLHLNISSMGDTVLYSFVVKRRWQSNHCSAIFKEMQNLVERYLRLLGFYVPTPLPKEHIGLECQVSAEELAVEVQQSFFPRRVYTNDM